MVPDDVGIVPYRKPRWLEAPGNRIGVVLRSHDENVRVERMNPGIDRVGVVQAGKVVLNFGKVHVAGRILHIAGMQHGPRRTLVKGMDIGDQLPHGGRNVGRNCASIIDLIAHAPHHHRGMVPIPLHKQLEVILPVGIPVFIRHATG